jgi:beta-phosphoglucomutase-like phosphatase (HAD superfamily)
VAPPSALVFKVEEVLCNPIPNYSDVYDLIKKEEEATGSSHKASGVGDRLLSLKKRMAPKAYNRLRALAESAAERAESVALSQIDLLPGVQTAFQAAHGTGWLVAAASDFNKNAVAKSLEQKSLAMQVDFVAARSRLDGERQLSKRLSPVKRKVGSFTRSVYFCNRSQEVREAKSLGMRCFVLPSNVESFRTLLLAEPDGVILSLLELPTLLALPSMKLPASGHDRTIDTGRQKPALSKGVQSKREHPL